VTKESHTRAAAANAQHLTAPDSEDPDVEVTLPSIQPEDHIRDKYLGDLYVYLTEKQLPLNNHAERITLLLSEDFFVGSDKLLYRISLPRGKHAKFTNAEIRLALPQKFISEVVEKVHQFDHFSKERNFQCLRSRFYAKNLFDAVCKYEAVLIQGFSLLAYGVGSQSLSVSSLAVSL